MDLALAPLLGVYGHCTQELVNLLTTGAATSGVFDGRKHVDGALISGVLKRPLVGQLAEMEVLRCVFLESRFCAKPIKSLDE